jgi:hypothetical protein
MIFSKNRFALFADHAVAAQSKLFEDLQLRQQIVNLVGIEHELRHRRVAAIDAFGQRLALRV